MKRDIKQWITTALMAATMLLSSYSYATSPTIEYNVDPVNGPYHTIQEAIDQFQGDNALYAQINIAPGTYVENVQLEQLSASANLQSRNQDLQEVVPNDTLLRGLQINGDMRPCFPEYQNGYEHASSNTQSQVYFLETDVVGVGPFPVLVSNSFGTQPLVDTGPYSVTESIPYAPTSTYPITNTFGGGFALLQRGSGGLPNPGSQGFATKTAQAEAAGAAAVIVVDTADVGTISMGGTDPSITIPAFAINKDLGAQLRAALISNPGMMVTVKPPQSFYNPPTGTNFAHVTLSHPGGQLNQIMVTMSAPLPIVDPNLPRGTVPVIEQPIFDDPRLGFGPGDKIIISEADIFGSGGRTVYEIESLSGNIITLTDDVDTADVDITKLGSSLTFLPNVLLMPEKPREPVFRAQSIGFSMNGLWIDTNPEIGFAATRNALLFSGVSANVANIIVTDTNYTSANGHCFIFAGESSVSINDGWRNSSQNRRLSSIGWANGILVEHQSRLGGNSVFVTNMSNGSAFILTGNSKSNLNSVILMGNYGLYQPGSYGLVVEYDSQLDVSNLLTVTDVFGCGIFMGAAGRINCPSLELERIYKPAGYVVGTNALQIGTDSTFLIGVSDLYSDDGSPTSLIRTSSVIKDCYDISPGDTLPNVGIFVDIEGKFISQKELEFSGNDVDYLTVHDNQFITPGWSKTPGNTFPLHANGKIDASYGLQEIQACDLCLTLDPAEEFQYNGVYYDKNNVGKTFTIFSNNATKHCLTLTSGSFVGTNRTTLSFSPQKGAYVTLKLLSPTEVLVLEARGVKFCKSQGCKNQNQLKNQVKVKKDANKAKKK